MKRSCLFYYFWSVFCVFVSLLKVSAQVSEIDSIILPGENNKVPALNFSYFPSRMHTFIWRNWTVVPVVRIAEVLNTSEENHLRACRAADNSHFSTRLLFQWDFQSNPQYCRNGLHPVGISRFFVETGIYYLINRYFNYWE